MNENIESNSSTYRELLNGIPTAWADHIDFAEWIVRKKKAKVVVDLGVDYGYSTFSFAFPKIAHVYGVDCFEGDQYTGVRNTYDFVLEKQRELGLDNITFIKSFVDDLEKTWDTPIDILHIDAFHTYDAVKNDFNKWSKFVKDDGIILLHDTLVTDHPFGVKKFFSEIELPKTNFEFCHGLGVVSKDSSLIEEIKKTFNLD